MIEILQPVKIAVLELSKSSNNLISADLIVSGCANKLYKIDNSIYEKFLIRIKQRRTIYSNILGFLTDNSEGNIFLEKPSDQQISEVYCSLFDKLEPQSSTKKVSKYI